MHIEARLFEFIAAFFGFCTILYGILTSLLATGGIEWAGTTALALTRGMALIIATLFRFVARRLDAPPEDYEGAEISDGEGELGFFSPHSWWPILIALSGSVAAVGIALWLPWLIGAGVVFVLSSAAGLVFEYYVGPERHWAVPARRDGPVCGRWQGHNPGTSSAGARSAQPSAGPGWVG